MVVHIMKLVEPVNVVIIGHAAVVFKISVVHEKYANSIFVCMVYDGVVVVPMNIALMEHVFI